MNNKVSIIIPCYNCAKYLKLAINSALNQTYKNIEVIVVNDGSTDNTEEIVKSISDSRLVYIKQENKGTAGARNTGIKHSTGDYIYPLDCDDTIDSTLIQSLVDNIENDNTILAVTARFVDINLNQIGRIWPEPDDYFKDLETLMIRNCIANGSLYPKRLFDLVGGYDESIGKFIQIEDWDFWIRCVISGAKIKYTNLYYNYRIHSNQYTAVSNKDEAGRKYMFNKYHHKV